MGQKSSAKNNAKNRHEGTQQEPLSGSKKVKNRNHSRQNKNPNHGL
ncbi:small acid-soluble spore protein P [Pallidibacillus pasinlerensis]|uniref:Small acid-soluble spore protein P n=1 Tax=Pallidibacillus pasinlerensis TaxID=2703818 RepID=A0ABX0AC45_9BACI|nr:small acid-soluble spore protein P [Pallidibacillus pasinlerensis]NCU19015.1 small acid-soluble spore protein P [Pallidibacillus pasinlerensis]